jgi:hypothetical protein
MMFVSSDKLHRKCTPLFLRPDQSFVWGPDLKSDLKRLNDYYASFSNDIKEKGIMSFASRPPVDKDFLVTRLWDRHLPAWRHISDDAEARDPEINKAIIDQFNKEIAAPTVSPEDLDFTDEDADFFTIQRKCRRRKGGWYLLPKDLKVDEGGTER